jgi:hypothetical protein
MALADAHKMGTVRDMQQRQTHARVDDNYMRNRIEMARKIIYEQNFAVDTRAVEELLKPFSLVPTLVSAHPWDIDISNNLNLLRRVLFHES